jgi:hypothetical protein
MFSPWYQQYLCFCHQMLVGWLEGNGVRLTSFAGRFQGEEKTAPCKLLAFATEEVIMPARMDVVNQVLVVGLIHMNNRCPKVMIFIIGRCVRKRRGNPTYIFEQKRGTEC